MTDYVQNLDAAALLTVEACLSFVVAAFASPPYNFPLFLFGIYTQERSEPTDSLKLFTGLLGVSAVLDFIWMFINNQNGFIKAISILILILKVPTFFATQRGSGPIGFPGGETVWSMPGGFSSHGNQGAYQTLGDDLESSRPAPPPHATPPPPPPATSTAQPPAVSNAYQSL
ncbi:hypothetical protein JB92DRAFT_1366168 [Gautieria morchelliformis]|nr:hypothetical protein JB92DRAFT_1366168 [Gautieria morchelliformis]